MLTILAEDQNAAGGMLPLFLVLCGVTIMVVMLRRHQMRKPKANNPRDAARDQVARIRDQQRLHETMDDLLVQLEAASRRVGAELDTKFLKLEAVIRDADQRIAQLDELTSGQTAAEPGASVAEQTPKVTFVGRRTAESVPEPEQGPEAPSSISRGDQPTQAPAEQAAAPKFNAERPRETPKVNARYAHVCAMIDGGASPIETAEKLGLPLGEVELIINLRNYQQ